MFGWLRKLCAHPASPEPPALPEGWAERIWTSWEAGHTIHHGTVPGSAGHEHRPVCPRCGEAEGWAHAAHLARVHGNPAARARWSVHETETARQLDALGPCRCGIELSDDQAMAIAVEVSAPYLHLYV